MENGLSEEEKKILSNFPSPLTKEFQAANRDIPLDSFLFVQDVQNLLQETKLLENYDRSLKPRVLKSTTGLFVGE